MDKTKPESIPYTAHEDEVFLMEKHSKRLWILCIIMFLALIITNAGWIYYESQFEDVVTTTYRSDADDGGNAIINDSGRVIVNGKGE